MSQRLAGKAAYLLLFAMLLSTSTGRALAESRVRAFAEVNVFNSSDCNEIDIQGTHSVTLQILDSYDASYPLGLNGEIRACSFIGALIKTCANSLPGPQWQGRVANCSIRQHGGKCNKLYKARTDGSLGNAFYQADGDVSESGCDEEICIIPEP